MEYLVGGAVVALVIFIFVVKSRVNNFDKLSVLPFATWRSIYLSSRAAERVGIARALIIQTLNLATKIGALSSAEGKEIEAGVKTEDPVRIIGDWLEMGLPHVMEVCGEHEVSTREARLVAVCMLVSLKGVNPERDLKDFLQKLNG